MSLGLRLLAASIMTVFTCAILRAQDSLQLMDGRIFSDHEMSRSDLGVTVHFKNGDILVPNSLIRLSTVGGIVDSAVKWSDEEQAKIARGLVHFEGRWVNARLREKTLAGRRESRAARIKDAQEHRKWVNRYRASTSHFEFEYTIDPEIMSELMEMMEVYFKTFTSEWGIKMPRGQGRLSVKFYHDEDYFQQVSGAPPGTLGFFRFVKPLELHFFYDRSDGEMTEDVMFHETNHYLTQLIDLKFKYPSWINESLAEYYGASDWDPVKKKMSTGKLQEGRLAVIQDLIKQDKWQGLEELIRIPHGSFNANHYAWGWSFVHFMLSNKKYSKRFRKFYMGLARDQNIKRKRWFMGMKHVEPDEQIRALKRYLKIKDLDALEKEWRDYVTSLEPATARGYHHAGRLALGYGMPIKASRLFNVSIELGSENPMTHYYLGQALRRRGKFDTAVSSMKTHLALDPLHAIGLLELARCLEYRDRKFDENEESARLRQLALEIAPDNYSVLLDLASRGMLIGY